MKIKRIFLALAIILQASLAYSEITVNSLFSDNAVLQHGIDLPVWGKANNGENITVEICGQKKSTVAKDGKWSLRLSSLPTGGPYTMTISGNNTITISNLLVGEVWICSGQSNMERRLAPLPGQRGIIGWEEAVANADFPQMRQFFIEKKTAFTPEEDANSKWTICSPEELLAVFSGVGFFFGRKLHQDLNVPVGLIFTAWGGTVAEAWTSAEALTAMPDFNESVDIVNLMAQSDPQDVMQTYMGLLENWYQKVDTGSNPESPWYLPTTDASQWDSITLPLSWEDSGMGTYDGVMWYQKVIDLPEDWAGKEAVINMGPIDDQDTTWINGIKIGNKSVWTDQRTYQIPTTVLKAGRNVIAVRVLDTGGGGGFRGKPEQMSINCPTAEQKVISLATEWKYKATADKLTFISMPTRPIDNPNMPTVLYNGMLAPLQPYAIRGVIWYQGESNNNRTKQYQTLFPLMIKDWRNRWQQGNFPFLFTQIAPYKDMSPEIREAQMLTLYKSPNTAMAVTTDVGDANDIHPIDKRPVGERLALAAEALAYDHKIEYSGPLYSGVEINGNKATLSFNHIGSGLMAKDGPLKGFVIAGPDKEFKPANAEIQGDKVVVWNDEIAEPVAVRYGWANVPDVNLFNKEGLPASPFRTDIE